MPLKASDKSEGAAPTPAPLAAGLVTTLAGRRLHRRFYPHPRALRQRLAFQGHAQVGGLQAADFIANSRRFLEFQIGRRLLHGGFQILDDLADILVDQSAFTGACLDGDMVAALVHAVENISDILFHAFRCNAMGGVIGDLSLAAALGLYRRAVLKITSTSSR